MTLAPLTRPRRLVPGDRVAVVAPSGPAPKTLLDTGCEILRGWGLEVGLGRHVHGRDEHFDYLAGSDADRARDLQEAWCDPAVAAVLCARGGYGVQRITERLDWKAMRAAGPKILVGYSDITALHSAVATHLGLATLHAPMVATDVFTSDARSAELLRRTLFEPDTNLELTSNTAETLVGGRAQGITVGGCVSLLAGEVGTRTGIPNAAGGIAVLEDLDEKAYRLDGFLTHLLRTGWFDGVQGVALGSWKDCEPVRELLLDRLGGLGVPIIWELGFGHCPSTLTIPLGVLACLDADVGTLTLEHPALV